MNKGYDRVGLYHDADDLRILVPKRVPKFGWTINVVHLRGKMAVALVGLAVLAGIAGSVG